jgi:dihydrofolate reductase
MTMKGFSIIVAFDEARGIGKDGVMPWHLPADLKHFKDVTSAVTGSSLNVLIMGRKTWESIPAKFRPLPGRLNVVITSQRGYVLPDGVVRASSLQEAVQVFCDSEKKAGDIFVIGGAQVFSEAIKHPLCEKIFLTLIHSRFGCDVQFPDIPARFLQDGPSRSAYDHGQEISFLTLSAMGQT